MTNGGYNQFCPVSKACEMLEPRWTLLILCEMWSGSSRFNEIRRGVPGMSPTLLVKRLREMEANGLIIRVENTATGEIAYRTTNMANELEPIVHALGKWAHRNIDTDVTLERLDARILMWNMRRKIDVNALPGRRRNVIKFTYPELPRDERNYWLLAKPGTPVDLCLTDPGYDVDLFVTADLKAMTSAWMGFSTFEAELAHERISLIGDTTLASSIENWMVRSSYAAA
ncbi:helix-turn-helix domain-containing protein [Rhizobium sp. BK251]|uniref:winged helix-turn-helix transcriptional regulator n=1 Tax=Rhizobium sp. BK251 TaxID=2512125 RepID=UPI00104AEA9F|nr:helix-turn-helix domain-containing protein [Rhizobium sp. BK251]TCL69667.1 HxlR family transcriptional regulator [Rhizobium sp. BK251]